jgi:hypothetical protein
LNIDEDTGDYPYLVTTAGVRLYSIPDIIRERTINGEVQEVPIRISKAIRVFSRASEGSDYGLSLLSGTFSDGVFSNDAEGQNFRFTSIPATEADSSRILFPFDPGDTTEKYRYVSLIEPQRLTADTVPVMIPEEFEFMLVEGALGWIEYNDYGRSDRMDKFKEQYAREFWSAFKLPEATIDYNFTSNRKF